VTSTNRNPDHDRRRVTDVIAAKKAPPFRSASQMAFERKESPKTFPISTSLKELDEALGGGVPRGSITEFVGPPGAGKTQFCMMLSASVSVTSMENTVSRIAYVDTEGAFSPERLFEIIEEKFSDELDSFGEAGDWREELGNRVMFYQAPTCAKLMTVLEKLDTDVVLKNYQLIIVDSIASTVRREFHGGQSESLVERAKLLAKIAKMLKELAQHHTVAVVATNQITTQFVGKSAANGEKEDDKDDDEDDGDDEKTIEEPRGLVTVALGNSWSHFVNVRIALDFDLDNSFINRFPPPSTSTRRRLKILKCPFARQTMLYYVLTERGPEIVSELMPLEETGEWKFSTKSALVVTSF